MRCISILAPILFSAAFYQPMAAQVIRGRVVDQRSRQGIEAVSVMILSADGSVQTGVMTGSDGRFELMVPAPGHYRIAAQLIGYDGSQQPITIVDRDMTIDDLVLNQVGVALVGLTVTATRGRIVAEPEAGGLPTILNRGILDGLHRRGMTLYEVATELLQLRVREPDGVTCVETAWVESSPSAGCRPVLLIIDGDASGDVRERILAQPLSEVESMELLPPAMAIDRFGDAGANGALVIRSREAGLRVSGAAARG